MIKNIMKNIGLKDIAKSNEKLLDRRDALIAKGKLSPEEAEEMKKITEKIQSNTSLMLGIKPAGLKAELFNALKNHKKTPGYNYSDFDEKDIDDFLEVAKTDMPNASPDELKNELISRYENAAKLTAGN